MGSWDHRAQIPGDTWNILATSELDNASSETRAFSQRKTAGREQVAKQVRQMVRMATPSDALPPREAFQRLFPGVS